MRYTSYDAAPETAFQLRDADEAVVPETAKPVGAGKPLPALVVAVRVFEACETLPAASRAFTVNE